MKPYFSIITAVRNGLPELQRTSSSLLQQTRTDFEWIVIDAASTDGTADWLSGLNSFQDRMYWISEPDEGISDAWNKGISRATGRQILILNAGDTYDKDLIQRFAREVNDQQVTCCHARLLAEDGHPVGLFRANPANLWRGMHLPHNWCSVPHAIYSQIGPYRRIPHAMDFDWFHRYYRKSGVGGFRVIDVALGEYRLGGHSDVHFREGFAANEKIMMANGMHPWLAALIRRVYTFRHTLMKIKIR
ncbi:MAG: glycosyltransferase involved in cell wall biosynthesis [Porticoccaceae bacterium]|jgi:glycosyltransferase involved in cell wall biosynthesis